MVAIKLSCFIGPFGEIVGLDLTHYIFVVKILTIYARSSWAAAAQQLVTSLGFSLGRPLPMPCSSFKIEKKKKQPCKLF